MKNRPTRLRKPPRPVWPARKKPGEDVGEKAKSTKESPAKDRNSPSDANVDANVDATKVDAKVDAAAQELTESHSVGLSRVTGIRHWSTPDYSRVAIDLESEIKFGSQRIASPDRIFFDLRGTKLASTLVGKSFDVDDGFLKKIRVAQFQPGRTRVVL